MASNRTVEFRGATAVVTGGASGIGRGMAVALAEAGSNVVLADLDEAALATTAEELGMLGVVTDVTDPDSVAALAEAVVSRYGAVHVVCNNAGVGPFGSTADMTLEDWDFVLRVNLFGVINGVHAFLPLLERNDDWGHVVNTSSISVLLTPPQAGGRACAPGAPAGRPACTRWTWPRPAATTGSSSRKRSARWSSRPFAATTPTW